jgi:hypothetical protein
MTAAVSPRSDVQLQARRRPKDVLQVCSSSPSTATRLKAMTLLLVLVVSCSLVLLLSSMSGEQLR